jgi:hypothetical protein
MGSFSIAISFKWCPLSSMTIQEYSTLSSLYFYTPILEDMNGGIFNEGKLIKEMIRTAYDFQHEARYLWSGGFREIAEFFR